MQKFEAWLTVHPPPLRLLGGEADSWRSREGGCDQPSVAAAEQLRPTAAFQRFHWRDAQAKAASLAQTHNMFWDANHGGYLCMPHSGNDAKQMAEELQPAKTPDSCPLLLTLPRVLWSPDAAASPLAHFHELAAAGPTPGCQLIVLLSADSAALGVCRGGELVCHKARARR